MGYEIILKFVFQIPQQLVFYFLRVLGRLLAVFDVFRNIKNYLKAFRRSEDSSTGDDLDYKGFIVQ